MRVTIADDDFLDECYGLNYEIDYSEIPIDGYEYVETKLPVETPPDYLHDDDHLDFSYLNVDDSVQFKDFSYTFEYTNQDTGSKFYLSISNEDFWFNLYYKETILYIKGSEILVERIPNVFLESNIQQFFLNTMSDEIFRINNLNPFESFQEFFKLHRLLADNANEIWSKCIMELHEQIISKIGEKIYWCKDIENFKTISEIIFMKSLDTQTTHLKKIIETISKLSSDNFKILCLQINSIISEGPNSFAKEIYIYQYQNNGKEYKTVSSITLFHLEKIYSSSTRNAGFCFRESQTKNFSVKPSGLNVPIALDLEVFSKELLNLVNTTSKEQKVSFNHEEIYYICQVLVNKKDFFLSRNEIVKFNEWLNSELNRLLFLTFLNFASEPSERIFRKGTYKNFARSITTKFRYRGLGYDNLTNYINSNTAYFKVTDINKSLIAFNIQHIKEAQQELKKGLVKKMLNNIIQAYKAL